MAKYYVTIGNLKVLVSANDEIAAALWAVNRYMGNRINFENALRPQVCRGLTLELDDSIAVSEIGFDQNESAKLSTNRVLKEWMQLVGAVKRLEEIFG